MGSYTVQAVNAGLAVYQAIQQQINIVDEFTESVRPGKGMNSSWL